MQTKNICCNNCHDIEYLEDDGGGKLEIELCSDVVCPCHVQKAQTTCLCGDPVAIEMKYEHREGDPTCLCDDCLDE